jgi:hypothetical protein
MMEAAIRIKFAMTKTVCNLPMTLAREEARMP